MAAQTQSFVHHALQRAVQFRNENCDTHNRVRLYGGIRRLRPGRHAQEAFPRASSRRLPTGLAAARKGHGSSAEPRTYPATARRVPGEDASGSPAELSIDTLSRSSAQSWTAMRLSGIQSGDYRRSFAVEIYDELAEGIVNPTRTIILQRFLRSGAGRKRRWRWVEASVTGH